MITEAYAAQMAAYNRWQNENLYGTADELSDEARRSDRGAFFGSIHRTLNHILWADQMWMSRLAGTERPSARGIAESPTMIVDWEELKRERVRFDQVILDWAKQLEPGWMARDLTWFSGAAQREITRPRTLLVAHMFNHQTHHRGQVHAMLTMAGVRPGDTDLMLMTLEA